MRASAIIATALVCGLSGAYGGVAWSEDVESALEKINISTDAQDAAQTPDKDTRPCVKATGVTCTTAYEEVNSNTYQANVIQGAIVHGGADSLGNTVPGVTINGSNQIIP